MSTPALMDQVGVWPVLIGLLLALTVLTLRLLALPLAAAVMALDSLAVLAARPLTLNSGENPR